MSIATAPLSQLDDSALIGLCIQKTPEAYNTLIKRYLKLVYNYIYRYVNNRELAEDLTQETFLRVYRSLNQYNQSRPFKPWLFTIATNVCKTSLKQNQQTPVLMNDDAIELNLLENLAQSSDQEESVSDVTLQQQLQKALNKLPLSVRQALILRHVYDLPCDEVATILQANPNTIKTWLKRGRESLKALLEKHGGLS